MYIFDNKITLEDRPILEEYLNSYEYRTSGLSFSSLYMWRDINEFSWDIVGDYMCMTGISHLELEEGIVLPFLFPPLTRDGNYEKAALRDTILRCRDIFEASEHPFSLRLVPAPLAEIISEACPEIVFREDRPNYDYLYRTRDLIELKGRAYHSKKNHLNYFKKTWDYEYTDLTSDDADEVMNFISGLNAKKDVPEGEMTTLRMEEEAIEDVLRNLERAEYRAGAIRIDGSMEAIAIGGRLGKDTVTEHVEKANTDYRGLYQVMLNEFCIHIASQAEYVNREEDMGIENLRKMKLSYKPIELVEKYIGEFPE